MPDQAVWIYEGLQKMHQDKDVLVNELVSDVCPLISPLPFRRFCTFFRNILSCKLRKLRQGVAVGLCYTRLAFTIFDLFFQCGPTLIFFFLLVCFAKVTPRRQLWVCIVNFSPFLFSYCFFFARFGLGILGSGGSGILKKRIGNSVESLAGGGSI